jgi:hypothetical protein
MLIIIFLSFRFSVSKLFSSRSPDLVKDTEQHERYAAPNENDFFLPIMPEDRDVDLHVRIAIEKLVAPAKDEHAHHDQSDNGNCKCNAQRWDGAFDYRGESGYLVTNQRAHFYPQFVLRANLFPPRRLQ